MTSFSTLLASGRLVRFSAPGAERDHQRLQAMVYTGTDKEKEKDSKNNCEIF
jgi:hypothetical protein